MSKEIACFYIETRTLAHTLRGLCVASDFRIISHKHMHIWGMEMYKRLPAMTPQTWVNLYVREFNGSQVLMPQYKSRQQGGKLSALYK